MQNQLKCFFCAQASLLHLLHSCESSFRGKPFVALFDLQHLRPWKHGCTLNHTCLPDLALQENVVLVIRSHQHALMGTRADSIDSALIKDHCAVSNLHLRLISKLHFLCISYYDYEKISWITLDFDIDWTVSDFTTGMFVKVFRTS